MHIVYVSVFFVIFEHDVKSCTQRYTTSSRQQHAVLQLLCYKIALTKSQT